MNAFIHFAQEALNATAYTGLTQTRDQVAGPTAWKIDDTGTALLARVTRSSIHLVTTMTPVRFSRGGNKRTEENIINKYLDENPDAHADSRPSTTPVPLAVSFDTIMELSKSNERWGGLPPAILTARIHIVTLVPPPLPFGKYRSIHAGRAIAVW